MEGTQFEPRNDLERLILDMAGMKVEAEDFVRRMLDMQIFMPIKDEKHQIAGFQRSTQAEPLVLADDAGHQALIAFSAPERAKAFLVDYPGYSGGLLVEFAWLLRRMGENMSIALNPGMEEGFDFDPEMVAMMATLLGDEE